jgi:hypothetical protein
MVTPPSLQVKVAAGRPCYRIQRDVYFSRAALLVQQPRVRAVAL